MAPLRYTDCVLDYFSPVTTLVGLVFSSSLAIVTELSEILGNSAVTKLISTVYILAYYRWFLQ